MFLVVKKNRNFLQISFALFRISFLENIYYILGAATSYCQGKASGLSVLSRQSPLWDDVHAINKLLHFLHVALYYLGSRCGIQLLMHIYSILILRIISGISFSLNPFVPFMIGYKLSMFFISSYTSWDLGTLKSWVPLDHLFSLIFQEAKHVYTLYSVFFQAYVNFCTHPPPLRTCHIELSLSFA